MKTAIIIIVTLFLINGVSAQENNSQNAGSNTRPKSKKEERNAMLEIKFQEKTALINGKRFVLEADFVINQQGNQFPAPSDINFIMVDSNSVVIQYGRNLGPSNNGVGGTTAKGTLTSWIVDSNEKKKSMNVMMSVNTSIGFFSVSIFIPASGRSTAKISPTRINLVGNLVPLEQSTVYEGRSL